MKTIIGKFIKKKFLRNIIIIEDEAGKKHEVKVTHDIAKSDFLYKDKIVSIAVNNKNIGFFILNKAENNGLIVANKVEKRVLSKTKYKFKLLYKFFSSSNMLMFALIIQVFNSFFIEKMLNSSALIIHNTALLNLLPQTKFHFLLNIFLVLFTTLYSGGVYILFKALRKSKSLMYESDIVDNTSLIHKMALDLNNYGKKIVKLKNKEEIFEIKPNNIEKENIIIKPTEEVKV